MARRLAIAGVHGAAAVIAREGDPDAVIAVGGHAGRHDGGRHRRASRSADIAEAVALAVHAAAERAKELA